MITTTDKPMYSKMYRYPKIHEGKLKNLLQQKIIRESNALCGLLPKKLAISGNKK